MLQLVSCFRLRDNMLPHHDFAGLTFLNLRADKGVKLGFLNNELSVEFMCA